MKKLYEKNELYFAFVWIGLYVVLMNIALNFCGGMDGLASKTSGQVAIPAGCALLLAVVSTAWIIKNDLGKKFGLCSFRGSWKTFLWFIPLILMSLINLQNGLGLNAPLAVSLLMMVNMAAAGYVEEIIFRGFLFRAMEKSGLKSAVIVSAVTFGAGHIVNLMNTADKAGVLVQVAYAIVIGFLYTVIVYKGGSLIPCILSHMFVNGSSVFAREQGWFTELVQIVFGKTTPLLEMVCSAAWIILISGTYALWLWKKAKNVAEEAQCPQI